MTDTGPVEPNKDNKNPNKKRKLLVAFNAILGLLLIVLGYPSVIFATVGCWAILIAIILLIAE